MKNFSIMKALVIIAGAMYIATLLAPSSQKEEVKAAPVTPKKIAPKEVRAKYASQGEALYSKWIKQYPSMRLRVIGQATTPTVEICVPRELWQKATKDEQIGLTYFVEFYVLKVKGDPVPHTLGDVSAPLGPRYQAEKIAHIKPDSWYVSTGVMKKGKSETVACDENAVHGDSDWFAEKEKYEANKWGAVPSSSKASVFRGLE